MKNETILVVGGAGYIGSHMAKDLLETGRKVVILDDLSTGHRDLIPGGSFIEGSLGDAVLLDRIFSKNRIDAVMHFAAFALVGESVEQPLKYYQNNVSATTELLSAMVRHDVKRFIFSSTAAVYGEPVEIPITEDHPKNPTNPYGASKIAVEQMLKDCDSAYGLKTISQKKNIKIFGTDYPTPDGTCVRDYIHVSDLAQAHLLSLDALMTEGESAVYNLGNSRGFSVREVIELARKITGHPIPVEETDRRPGDPATLIASSDKIKRELGWKPQYEDLEKIIQTAWRWHRKEAR